MDVYTDSIRDMDPLDKLRLVERIWDDLATEGTSLPLPQWAVEEAARRRDEMVQDPNLGDSHEDVWKRINQSRND